MVTDDYGQNPHIRGLQGPFCVEVTFQEIPKNHHITGFPGPFCVEASEDRQFGQVGVWTLDPPPLGERKCMVLHRKSNGFGMASEDR